MSGWTKQKAHLRKIRNIKRNSNNENNIEETTNLPQPQYDDIDIQCNLNNNQKIKHSPMECTFATHAAGLTFTQAKHFSAEMNESYTSETSFYKMQKKLDPVVQEYAKESMQAARTQSMLQSNNEIYVSGDGRYPVKKIHHIAATT